MFLCARHRAVLRDCRVCVFVTWYAQFELVSRFGGVERDFVSVGLDERIVDVAEDVDLAELVELLFAPQDRVVEHVVAVGVETALHRHVVADVDDVILRLGDHREILPCTVISHRRTRQPKTDRPRSVDAPAAASVQ